MRTWIFVGLVAIGAGVPTFAQTSKVVGYYPNWGPSLTPAFTAKSVDYARLTHVVWSFVWPDSLGNVTGYDAAVQGADLDTLVGRAHAAGVKAVVSLGGAGQCDGFGPTSRNAARRARFCHQVKAFVRDHRLDGVDLDWEYADSPSALDTAGYTALVRELRDSLGRNLSLSAALPASDWTGKWFSVKGFVDSLDWIGIMTYDLTGGWDTQTGHNSPLFDNSRQGVGHAVADISVSSSMSYWNKTRGVPKSKLLYGQPFFGFLFPKATSPGSSFSGNVAYLDYRDIADSLRTWTVHWDDTAKARWATTPGGGYATWDDPGAVALKARWARDNGYAGAIVWDLAEDRFPNAGHPLLDSLSAILRPAGSGVTPGKGVPTARLVREGRFLTMILPTVGAARLELRALDGRMLRKAQGTGGELRLDLAGLPTGLMVARLNWASGAEWIPIVLS